jgi:Conserved TM helix/Mechanosensitive ion channel
MLQELLKNLAGVVPTLFAAITLLVAGYFISNIISRIITTMLEKIGIDKLADKLNEIDVVQQYDISIRPSAVVGRIVKYFLTLIFLIMATDVLGMAAVSQLVRDVINYVPSLVIAMLVMVVALFIANALKGIVVTACRSIGVPSPNLIGNVIFYFVFLTGMVSALSQAKVDTDFVKSNLSIILGGAVGAFALGYGLASRDMMANFLGSMYSRRRFRIGDVIRIDNMVGRIVALDNTSVVLNAPDRQIIIPLSKLTREPVEILPNDFLQLQNKG